VYPRRLIFEYRRFGTIYLFHLQRLDTSSPAFEDGTDRWFRNVGIKNQTLGIHPKDDSQVFFFFP
jgi:hypothetical protein